MGLRFFDILDPVVEKITDNITNITIGDVSFSYICLKMIGAPSTIDCILRLGVTNCKNVLFIGSVGSLDPSINIGDIVVPMFSVTGDGASRFLNKNLEDEFGKKQYPDEVITTKLKKIVDKIGVVNKHLVGNYSVDTIFAQFPHIDYMLNLGCNVVEMETASLFKAAKICNISATALFVVSDCTVTKKSLYSGRTEVDVSNKYKSRYEFVPNIIRELFKEI